MKIFLQLEIHLYLSIPNDKVTVTYKSEMQNKRNSITLLILMCLCLNLNYGQIDFSLAFNTVNTNNTGWRLKQKRKLYSSGRTMHTYSYDYEGEYLETYTSGSAVIRYVYDNTKNKVTSHFVKKNGELKSSMKKILFEEGMPSSIAFRKNFKNYDIKMQFFEGRWIGFQDKNSEQRFEIKYDGKRVISATMTVPIVGPENVYLKYEYIFNWNNNRLEDVVIKKVRSQKSGNTSNTAKDVKVEYTYNSANQLVEIKALPLFRYTFAYDENGNVAERTEHVGRDHFVYEWEKGGSNTSVLLNDYFSWLKNPLILPFSL